MKEGRNYCWTFECTKFLFCCRDRMPRLFDFGRPGFQEAKFLALMNLIATTFFWGLSLYDASDSASSTIISSACESALDLGSTVVFLWRFASLDALMDTPFNRVIEERCSCFFAFILFCIGCIITGFGAAELLVDAQPSESELRVEVTIAFPSAIIYLIIGMMQLHMGWALRLRSFALDALISIFGAISSLLAVLSVIINLAAEQPSLARLPVYTEDGEMHHMILKSQYYRYWWMEDAFAVLVGIIMIYIAIFSLVIQGREGVAFWTWSFWASPLPPREGVINLSSAKSESTPLKS